VLSGTPVFTQRTDALLQLDPQTNDGAK
jgi:circadian clock protein KaiC